MERFARDVGTQLAPGGAFAVVEFHPVAGMFMFEDNGKVGYPYFGEGEPVETEGVPDYVGEARAALSPSGFESGEADFVNPHPDYTYPWSLAQIVGAFLKTGFSLERFEEYPYCNGGGAHGGHGAPARQALWPAGEAAGPAADVRAPPAPLKSGSAFGAEIGLRLWL